MGPGDTAGWSQAMDYIPNAAIAMGVGLVVLIWVFLVHMNLSQGPDAHLRFLLDLVRDGKERPGSLLPRGSEPGRWADFGADPVHDAAKRAGNEGKQDCTKQVWREVPLLFATSLRGRGL